MAEEPTSAGNAPETPLEGQAQASESTTPQSQPKQDKVNLFDLPEFKGYQQQFNRTVSALQSELQQLKAQQTQAQMSGMDDLEKANYLLQQKDQEIAQFRQAYQQQQIEMQRQADIAKLSGISGAPAHIFADVNTYDDAVTLAFAWMKDQGYTKAEMAEAKKEANAVDLGGGGAVTPLDRETKERNELLKKGDTRGYILKMLEG